MRLCLWYESDTVVGRRQLSLTKELLLVHYVSVSGREGNREDVLINSGGGEGGRAGQSRSEILSDITERGHRAGACKYTTASLQADTHRKSQPTQSCSLTHSVSTNMSSKCHINKQASELMNAKHSRFLYSSHKRLASISPLLWHFIRMLSRHLFSKYKYQKEDLLLI